MLVLPQSTAYASCMEYPRAEVTTKSSPPRKLSPREDEIIHLGDAGLSRADIAQRLGLSIWTVANHRKQGSRKLIEQTSLTPREIEVGTLLALGRSTADIARELGIARNTAMEHRRLLMSTLGFHSVVELTHYAIIQRWVKVGDALRPRS